jgi:hypothetical protein
LVTFWIGGAKYICLKCVLECLASIREHNGGFQQPIPAEPLDPVKEAVKTLADLDTSTMTQVQWLALIDEVLKFLVKRELARVVKGG